MILILLSFLGVLNSLFLYFNQLSNASFCFIGNCNVVLSSAFSSVGPFSLSIIGFFAHLSFFFFAIFFFKKPSRILFVLWWSLALLGFLCSLYLFFLQALVIHAFCFFCLLSLLLFFLYFVTLSSRPLFGKPLQSGGIFYFFTSIILSLIFSTAVFFSMPFLVPQPTLLQVPTQLTLWNLSQFPSTPISPNPILQYQLGADNAQYIVTVFSDFECTHCAKMHQMLLDLQILYPYTVTLIYRHLPLPQHRGAMLKAAAGICAQNQGKFEQASTAFFKDQKPKSAPQIRELFQHLGFDLKAYDQCMNSKLPSAVLTQDLILAQNLHLRGTPSVFVLKQF